MNIKENKFYFLFFCVLLTAAAAIRLPYLFTGAMWSDEALYAWLGQRIFESPSLVFSKEVMEYHPPLFAIFLALGHLCFPSEFACRLVIFIFYLLGIYLIYLLGIKMKNPFAGSFSAVMLAFNYSYFFYSTKILQDVALTILFMIFFLILFEIDSGGNRMDFFLGLCGCAVILMKMSGLLVVPVMIFYYFLVLDKMPIRDRLLRALVPLVMMGGMLALIVLNNYLRIGPGSIWTGFADLNFSLDRWQQLLRALTFPAVPLVFLFVFWGGVSAKRNAKILLFSWCAFFLLGLLSLKIGICERYTLYILPCLILMFAMGFEEALTFLSRTLRMRVLKVIIIAVTSLLFVYKINEHQASLRSHEYFYQGYRTAAARIRQIYHPGMLVVAGAPRQMRYYTGINFQEFGGDLVGLPREKGEFEKLVRQNKNIILVIDRWETIQPPWAFPLTQEGLDYVTGLGFKADDQVERECLTLAGKEKALVFWIFTK